MASAFGITDLRSRFAGWRGSIMKRVAIDAADHPVQDFRVKHADLGQLIEGVVIPRLFAQSETVARPAAVIEPSQPDRLPAITPADADELARLSLLENPQPAFAFIDGFVDQGHSVEKIFIQLLAPAARQLGVDWEEDSRDFVDVTMGLWRIQEILRDLSSRVPPSRYSRGGHKGAALFSTMPGDQHSFGTMMIGDYFERAGWQVDCLIDPTRSQINAAYAARHYDLVGLTISNDCSTGLLRSTIRAIKSISVNPDVVVMIGGRFINDHPDLVAECGADATAADATAALQVAEQMLRIRLDRTAPLI